MNLSAEVTNLALLELCKVVSRQTWFHGVQLRMEEGKPYAKLITNEKPKEEALSSIPREINGLKVRIFYHNPLNRMR